MTFQFFIVILIIAVLQMVLGMIWYGPKVFGNFWMKLNGADKYSLEEIKEMQKSMMPYYALQFALSLWSAFATINLITFVLMVVDIHPVLIVGFVFLAFTLPMLVQSVIWGTTEKKYWLKQILVMSGYQFLAALITAGVFYASVVWF